ncbi:hypothetical protein KR018_008458 [Drosophila ironensis]|nr:hypothetical protein KR018_008458 [Drosophila ironensis]
MDSQMLNVFHEDPFEGNFVKYETDTNFWSHNDDLQLTDTLNGILPIAPTDESLLNHNRDEELRNGKNLLIYSDFEEQQLDDQNAKVLAAQVYQALSDSDIGVTYEQHREDTGGEDALSQCSESTFRTRTDSSSIGDYESHSSDYEEEDDDFNDQKLLNTNNGSILRSTSERKSRTLSTNTVASEADAFGLNIDVNNFDLADFITKDDFAENLNSCHMKSIVVPIVPQKSVAVALPDHLPPAKYLASLSSKSIEADDDSDTIIDVETIDVVDVDETLWPSDQPFASVQAADDFYYIDNVKADPSWCPNSTKKSISTAKESKPQNTEKSAIPVTSLPKAKVTNICLVPNKKQSDFLKRKGRAACSVSKPGRASAKKLQDTLKSLGNQTTAGKPAQAKGLGLGGKNLALLKQQREAVALPIAASELSVQASSVPNNILPSPTPVPPKRKLNLEEYKQRRGGGVSTPTTNKPSPPKQAKLESGNKDIAHSAVPKAAPSPQKTAIANIVNSLKCPSQQPTTEPLDPITIAKNKVLRMLEIKRAQQLKIIDSRVSAKVPRVTKLLPLKDIVKGTYCLENESSTQEITTSSTKLHPDYEEIIIVSVGSNTDISIPPNQMSKASPRSLLKSSVLLYNISNSHDATKNMSNSLIASIQSELVKKTGTTLLPTLPSNSGQSKLTRDTNVQHGEDMVIMHLPKDRVRKTLVSIETQTDLQPEFPLLLLPNMRKSRKRTRRNYRKRGNESPSNGYSSFSGSSSDCSSVDYYKSRSRSDSLEQLRNIEPSAGCGEGSIANGGYSSRSTHRHRSSVSSSSYSEAGKFERRQRRTSYNKRRSKNQKPANYSSSGSENSDHEANPSPHSIKSDPWYPNNSCSDNNNRRGFVDRNVSQPAVEERRIVYVGRIEQETTKEILRRKFLPYGSIKQITIHFKENGMKYGFVTFDRAQDAFTAIDTSSKNPLINMYDISFGGRRAFCRASYADLDNAGINNYNYCVFPKEEPAPKAQEDSFEALLLSVKAKLNSGKSATPAAEKVLEPQLGLAATTQRHLQM